MESEKYNNEIIDVKKDFLVVCNIALNNEIITDYGIDLKYMSCNCVYLFAEYYFKIEIVDEQSVRLIKIKNDFLPPLNSIDNNNLRLLKLYWKRAFTLYEKLQDILGGTAYRAEEQITIMANEDGTKTPVMGLILRYVSIENGFGDDKFPQIPENIRQLIRKKIDSSVGAEKEVAEQKIKSYGLCYDYLKSIQSKISALAFIEGLEIALPILPVFNEYCYAELDMFGNVKSATQTEQIHPEAADILLESPRPVLFWNGHDKGRFLSIVLPEKDPKTLAKEYWVTLKFKNEKALYDAVYKHRKKEISDSKNIDNQNGIVAMKKFLGIKT